MTTFIPRTPYTKEELAQLYPQELELQLVQVVSIHHITNRETLYTTVFANTIAVASSWFVLVFMPCCIEAPIDHSDQAKEVPCHLAFKM